MKQIPRIPIAILPTPVQELSKLTNILNGPRLWVKRDDQTGLAFGGNKTRKLEYLLADAKQHGARTLITTGSMQSNHCRQTAAAAAYAGMRCILVLVGNPIVEFSGNTLLNHLFGARIVWTEPDLRDDSLNRTFNLSKVHGEQPYLIPYGGSNPIGAVGYVNALGELLSQKFIPDWIVLASSSGGTQAGLLVGAHHFGFQGRILGISIDLPAAALKGRIAELANQTTEHLDSGFVINPEEVLVNDDYLGGGYGLMGSPEAEAIALFAREEGLLLDPVYTGRAGAGLIDLIRRGFFSPEQTILFWHTGGSPALFADQYRYSLIDI